jgi:hypothetical protein
VTSKVNNVAIYQAEFDKLYTDASYSAQTYYEASKAAELWGRALTFVPALLAAASSLLIILGLSKLWSVVGVIAGVVGATSSFLGAERKSAVFRNSGNTFTKIRHEARMWRDSLVSVRSEPESFAALTKLRDDYAAAIDRVELPSNRFFEKADRRIKVGVLNHSGSARDGKH